MKNRKMSGPRPLSVFSMALMTSVLFVSVPAPFTVEFVTTSVVTAFVNDTPSVSVAELSDNVPAPPSVPDWLSVPPDTVHVRPDPIVTGDFRLGDVRHVFASIERARAELGYEPAVSFASGMAEFASAPLRSPVGSR